jgi:hypothetical protein
LVSRRHARIVILPDAVRIEDLQSVNGVFVNSRRIKSSEALRAGDHIQIGKTELILRVAARSIPPQRNVSDRFGAETLHGHHDLNVFVETLNEEDRRREESTTRGDALELLGGVADKVLALGRVEEAEKMLGTALTNIINDVRTGSTPRAPERAVHFAIKLAEGTHRGKWIDYAIELYTMLRRPLPTEIVDQLYVLLRKTSSINVSGLRAYLEVLHANQGLFGPGERFVIQRIEGLERLAALK